jgi:hypothetical protein
MIDYGFEEFEGTFNPITKYKNSKLNWLGAITISIILNIIFMPNAIIFWIYKLFTAGRR